MRNLILWIVLAIGAPTAALACPDLDKEARNQALAPHFAELKASKSADDARAPVAAIWDIWTRAPDPKSQAMFDIGVQQLRASDYTGSQSALSQLVAYCPNYAEGWNQLAFSKFLAGDLEGALADLDVTLELAPNHFAAIAGKGMTLLRMGRTELAHKALRQALEIHPWMSERRLLPPEEKI